MIKKKKAKKTGKKTSKAAPKRRSGKKKPKDMAQVREEIAEIVKDSANEITVALVDQAVHGQSAQAKYLFEVAKIYPVVEGEETTQEEDCLAKMLLEKLQPPKKKADEDDDEEEGAVTNGQNAGSDSPGVQTQKPPLLESSAGVLELARCTSEADAGGKIPEKEESTTGVV